MGDEAALKLLCCGQLNCATILTILQTRPEQG